MSTNTGRTWTVSLCCECVFWWGSMNGNTPLRLCAELDSFVCRMVCKAWSMPSCPCLSPCKSPWHMQCEFCRIPFSPSSPIIASWLCCFLPQLERDRCWCSLSSREVGEGALILPLVVLMPLLKWERQKKEPQGGSKPLGSHSFLTHMCVCFLSNFPKQHSAGMEQLASLCQHPGSWPLEILIRPLRVHSFYHRRRDDLGPNPML